MKYQIGYPMWGIIYGDKVNSPNIGFSFMKKKRKKKKKR
jgi:hypothetical protein